MGHGQPRDAPCCSIANVTRDGSPGVSAVGSSHVVTSWFLRYAAFSRLSTVTVAIEVTSSLIDSVASEMVWSARP